ncbi:MAG: cell division protein FtsX [Candidatus Parcubacteria bacterium]|nr:ABC transporter permease [Patescibacteria group bacterium]BCX16179.1 MAG: cell division protein FtsX [Candidatus Parcubacteria bacterium]
MITALVRVIKYGIQNFLRNAWLSGATIVVMVMTLTVFGGLIIGNIIARTVINSIQEKIDISVYFKNDSPEDEILRIKSILESLPEVKMVEYVSKEEALSIFKEKHKDDATISQALEQLNENPLLASLNIKARQPEEYSVIAGYLNNDSIKPFVEKVSYSQNAAVINRLNKILSISRNGGMILTIVMTLIAILITFNTIRLAIYSSRESINIMKLVGGSNFFIRTPFLVEGVIYGIISAFLSLLVIGPVVYFASPYIKVMIPELNLWQKFMSDILVFFSYQLIFGVGVGLVSSFIAIGKYLKD